MQRQQQASGVCVPEISVWFRLLFRNRSFYCRVLLLLLRLCFRLLFLEPSLCFHLLFLETSLCFHLLCCQFRNPLSQCLHLLLFQSLPSLDCAFETSVFTFACCFETSVFTFACCFQISVFTFVCCFEASICTL